MKGIVCICAGILLWGTVSFASGSECPRTFVEGLLIAEGLDQSRAKRISQDLRIDVRPDIVIKNLFHSSPKGTAARPDVMRVDPREIERGRAFIRQHAEILARVEERFGASPQIITAILMIESRLGTYPMPYNVATAYVNLAFLLDPEYFRQIQTLYSDAYPQLFEEATVARAHRRARWAVTELYYLSAIADHLDMDPVSISGSFAGALGPAQFIPSSFWTYGIDGDGDGIADPFNMADAKLSMGQYLRKFGWRENAPVEQKRKAVWYYNRSTVYVNTIMMLYEELKKP
jgi:membrane-bound lytic murein transglycosylase B